MADRWWGDGSEMAARGRVKTMVPRACSTLDGQTKKTYTIFPASIGHNSHPSRLMTRKLGLVKFLPYDAQRPAYLLEYTILATSDSLFEEDGVFRFYINTCQVNTSKDPHSCPLLLYM